MEESDCVILDIHEADGFKTESTRNINITVRTKNNDGEELDDVRDLTVVIFTKNNGQQLDTICLEILDDNDIYFVYDFSVSVRNFEELADEQELSVDFIHFIDLFKSYVVKSQETPDLFKMSLTLEGDDKAILTFSQKLKFKFADILNVDMTRLPKQTTQRMAQAKYNLIRKELEELHNQYENNKKNVMKRSPVLARKLERVVNRIK